MGMISMRKKRWSMQWRKGWVDMNWVDFVIAFNNTIIIYTIIIVTIFCMTTLSAAVTMSRKFQESKENFHIFDIISEDSMPVSIILPAYNEVKVIVCLLYTSDAADEE